MTVTKIYQVVGVRFKEYKLFKLILETRENFRINFLESIRDDRKDITIDDVYSLLDDLIEEKKIDKKCNCEQQKKDKTSLVEETLNLIPDVINIIHNYNVHLCKQCIHDYTFNYIHYSMFDLENINLPNEVKIYRITHDLGSEDFIVGILLNELDFDEHRSRKNICNETSIEDVVKKSEIITETMKNIKWNIDPTSRIYIVQNDCCCCS